MAICSDQNPIARSEIISQTVSKQIESTKLASIFNKIFSWNESPTPFQLEIILKDFIAPLTSIRGSHSNPQQFLLVKSKQLRQVPFGNLFSEEKSCKQQ